MTQLEVAYRYVTPPTEATMRALDNVREVYGIRRITFKESDRIVRVEFDASRFKEPVIAGLKISRIVGHRHRGPSECPRAHAFYLENFSLTLILSKGVSTRQDGKQGCGR